MGFLEKINEGEIDDWFEEEKENLDRELLELLNKGGSFEKEKKKYDNKYKKLLIKYEKKLARAERRNKVIDKINNKLLIIKRFFKKSSDKGETIIKNSKLFFKKKRFEIEYKWLFKKK